MHVTRKTIRRFFASKSSSRSMFAVSAAVSNWVWNVAFLGLSLALNGAACHVCLQLVGEIIHVRHPPKPIEVKIGIIQLSTASTLNSPKTNPSVHKQSRSRYATIQ